MVIGVIGVIALFVLLSVIISNQEPLGRANKLFEEAACGLLGEFRGKRVQRYLHFWQ